MQSEGMRENVGSAVRKELQTDDDRKNRQRASCQNGHHKVNDPAISQNGYKSLSEVLSKDKVLFFSFSFNIASESIDK